MSIIVLFNEPVGHGPFCESDAGVLAEVQAVSRACDDAGIKHREVAIRRLADLPAILAHAPEPLLFNLVEALAGPPEDVNSVPAVCHAFGKECTGSGTAALTLTLDKALSKAAMAAAGVRVPAGLLVEPGDPIDWQQLPTRPCLIKPARTDASEGIHAERCFFPAPGPAMADAVRALQADIKGAVLVEEYAGHRELNVALWENKGEPQVLAIAEIDFSAFGEDRPRIVDYAAKWLPDSFEYNHTPRLIPAPLSTELYRQAEQAARTAWRVCGCRDYARVDMRLDDQDRLYVLEVNANPDISPDAGFAAALEAAGVAYSQFVQTIVGNARARQSRTAGDFPARTELPRLPDRTARIPAAEQIRFSRPADREPVLAFIRDTGFFRDNEVDVAAEVLDEAAAKGPSGHYQSFVMLSGQQPAGWVCFGPTPCSEGTYDLYWIAVSPHCQGQGVGKALMAFAEERIRQRGGRLIIIETSGRAIYAPTRGFYLGLGYTESARVPDFYAPDDDKVVYSGRL